MREVWREDGQTPGDLRVAAIGDWREMRDLVGHAAIDAGPDLRGGRGAASILRPGKGMLWRSGCRA